jgi:curved DNA-binding protein
MIDPFQVLGLPQDATRADIDAAWRQLARRHHPDRGGRAETFRLARWAYQRITDPASVPAEPPEDIRPGRGADVRARLRVPLMAALGGGDVRLAGRHVHLPPDLGPGEVLTLRGEGRPGDPPGDLILEIEVIAPDGWEIDGLDVVAPLPVTWFEMYSGRAVAVQLPGGREGTVPITPETRAGDLFTLAGLGLSGADGRGDLRLVVDAVHPEPGDATLASVLLRMQHGLGDDLRHEILRGAT